MAYAMTPNPADYDAPGTCEHRDCAATWAFYETPCPLCGEPFVNPDKWVTDEEFDPQRRPLHFRCFLERLET